MLLRFKIKNFLSFYEKTAFDMFPNVERKNFQRHIHGNMEVPVLKQAAIYGANGSGKSNFIKAMIFLRDFITRQNFLKSINWNEYIFQLTKEKLQTISFEIEFFHREEYYIYNVEIGKKEIFEKLSNSGVGKADDKLIFERRGTNIIAPSIQDEQLIKKLLSMNSRSSLIPLNLKFPILASEKVKHVYDWFSKKMEVILTNSTIPMLIKMLSQKPQLLSFANKVFKNIGIGIDEIKIRNTPFEKLVTESGNTVELKQIINSNFLSEDSEFAQLQNNRNVFNVIIQEGKKTVQELLFNQIGQGGYHKAMKISAQSDGTVRLLTLIPALWGAMNEGKVIFIDEIESSVHPRLMFELLRFYADNNANGQIIFTTHVTQLLNQQELVRPDEIWFV
ncbi:MAG: ATP-binding protein, partial [Planctomycetaceae bacterium]|nr:ATP-binding protein [Planctomycetaceae bacterium]